MGWASGLLRMARSPSVRTAPRPRLVPGAGARHNDAARKAYVSERADGSRKWRTPQEPLAKDHPWSRGSEKASAAALDGTAWLPRPGTMPRCGTRARQERASGRRDHWRDHARQMPSWYLMDQSVASGGAGGRLIGPARALGAVAPRGRHRSAGFRNRTPRRRPVILRWQRTVLRRRPPRRSRSSWT